MRLTFRTLALGERFTLNGNVYRKQSSRTARMIDNGRIFYVGQYEACEV